MGAHLGWKMLWKGGAGRLGQFVFLFTSMQAVVFHLQVNSWACPLMRYASWWKSTSKPVKTYERAHEIPPYGVGHYCDMAVSPTRSPLLWSWYYLDYTEENAGMEVARSAVVWQWSCLPKSYGGNPAWFVLATSDWFAILCIFINWLLKDFHIVMYLVFLTII